MYVSEVSDHLVSPPPPLHTHTHTRTHTQFVHHAISDLCEKRGLQYEDFAKKITLAEYSQLKRVLYTTLHTLARENGRKEEVCVCVYVMVLRNRTLDFCYLIVVGS